MFAEYKGLVDLVGDITSGKNIFQLKKHIRSISAYSANNIFYFPMYVSTGAGYDEVEMVSKTVEKQAAAFVMACMSLIPFHTVSQADRGSIEEYLNIFHQNIGIDVPYNVNDMVGKVFNESSTNIDSQATQFFGSIWKKSRNLNEYVEKISHEVVSMNECYQENNLTPMGQYLRRKVQETYKLNEANEKELLSFKLQTEFSLEPNAEMKANALTTQQRQDISMFPNKEKLFSEMDVKKANELLPLFFKVNVGFIIRETGETIKQEILVGVKAFVHRIDSSAMVSDMVNSIRKNQKFLRFVQFTTGETKSLMDLLFGFKQIRADAAGTKNVPSELSFMIKRRANWAKKGIPFITKNWNPNVTMVMTMSEVMFMKEQLGVDVMSGSNVKAVMSDNFLLMFIILDQINKQAHIMYDGHRYQFQEVSYTALERETTDRDRATRELFKTFARGRG